MFIDQTYKRLELWSLREREDVLSTSPRSSSVGKNLGPLGNTYLKVLGSSLLVTLIHKNPQSILNLGTRGISVSQIYREQRNFSVTQKKKKNLKH